MEFLSNAFYRIQIRYRVTKWWLIKVKHVQPKSSFFLYFNMHLISYGFLCFWWIFNIFAYFSYLKAIFAIYSQIYAFLFISAHCWSVLPKFTRFLIFSRIFEFHWHLPNAKTNLWILVHFDDNFWSVQIVKKMSFRLNCKKCCCWVFTRLADQSVYEYMDWRRSIAQWLIFFMSHSGKQPSLIGDKYTLPHLYDVLKP